MGYNIYRHTEQNSLRPALGIAMLCAALCIGAAATPVCAASSSDFDLLLNLRLSEMMYNPQAGSDFEYMELLNISQTITLDLGGSKFVEGITFEFPANTLIAPGAYLLVINHTDAAAFRTNYNLASSVPVVGAYTGKLSNGGEVITLKTGTDATIFSFEFSDSGSWPTRADGEGSSLEIEEPYETDPLDYEKASSWQSSGEYNGSPNREGKRTQQGVIINEVLSHTDPPMVDSIEIMNKTTETINLAGWYLSDSANNYFKFELPDPTFITPNGYVVFDENKFNPTPLAPGPNDFALSGAHGDEVHLLAKEPDGGFIFASRESFDAAFNGESFGRWPNGDGALYPMAQRSLGSENPGPRVGPVIISEIHYNSGAILEIDTLEFIEIHNPTDVAKPLDGWRLWDGIEFMFTAAHSLPAHGTLVVVPFSPSIDTALLSTFRQTYSIDATVTIVGPYLGALANAGETVQLHWPDEPPSEEPDFIPYLLKDEVDYNDRSPWPEGADGNGKSLNRLATDLFGNDPTSWGSADPTPGTIDFSRVEPEPKIVSQAPLAAMVGVKYKYDIEVTGVPAPTLAVVGMPEWMGFDGDYRISGKPESEDKGITTTIRIVAANASGNATQEFQIIVVGDGTGMPAWKIR